MISAVDRHKNHFRAIIIAPVGIKFLMRCEKGGDNALGIFGQMFLLPIAPVGTKFLMRYENGGKKHSIWGVLVKCT